MRRLDIQSFLVLFLSVTVLLLPLINVQNVNAQVGTVVTTKTITPSCVTPGQSLTVKINISVTGGGGGPGGLLPIQSSLVIDRTGSMFGAKFEDAKDAAQAFVNVQHDDDLIEVVTFSETIKRQINFTLTDPDGKTKLNNAIEAIISPYGYTNLYGAFQQSANDILAEGKSGYKKAILLMTDGRPNIGVTTAPKFVQLAQSVVTAGAVVYTIGLGGPLVSDPVNATLLQAIADAGNGKYYFAPTSSDLIDIYLQISEELQGTPAKNVRVTETLPTSIVTYNNDASISPNSTTADTIFWQIPLITAGTFWAVTFTVTAQERVAVVQSLSPTNIIYDREPQNDIQIDLPPGMAVREVAVNSMQGSKTTVTKGDVVKYNATVANYGTMSETFIVGLFANSTRLTSTSVTLSPGNTRLVEFNWNTSNYDVGFYNIAITADPDRAISCDEITNSTKSLTLVVNPISESSILPLIIMMMIPFIIIPIVAAALLGRRRRSARALAVPARRVGPCVPVGPCSTVPVAGTSRMVCPRCYRPLNYYPEYQKWYCQYCRRYA